MPDWFRRKDGQVVPGEDKNDLSDIEFKPEVLRKEIDTSIETKFAEFSTKQQETLKPVLEMAAAIQAERAEKAELARKAAERKNTEENEVTAEDFMLDPVGAMQKVNRSRDTATLMLAARMAAKDTLEDKEYYHGDIKSKVDQMVAAQPLENRIKPDVIENCYKLVMFDHMKDINEGKIKSKNNAASFESNGTGGANGKGTDTDESMSPDEKLVASRMGISEKDWIASRREMSYV